MEPVKTDPGDFIATLPEEFRADVTTLDAAISGVMAGLDRTLWQGRFWGGTDQTIIGYGTYTHQRRRGTSTWFIVGLAVQKNYLSVYVNAVEDGKYVAEKYAQELGKAKIGKSSISFRRLADIDLDALLRVVGIARTRLLEPRP